MTPKSGVFYINENIVAILQEDVVFCRNLIAEVVGCIG